jgi:hypothetical protein
MKIFILACLRDFELFELQCRSIKKYLITDEVNIVINEPDKCLKDFYRLYKQKIKPIFQGTHTVNFIEKTKYLPENKVSPGYKGWVTQQILKMSCLDTEPYAVLDTKNIFIRPTSMSEFVNANRYKIEYMQNYKEFAQICNEYFPASHCRGANTPYVINPEVCKKIYDTLGGYDKFVNWFLSHTDNTPSEFVLHDMASQYFKLDLNYDTHPLKSEWICFVFDPLDDFQERFDYITTKNMVKILSVHPRVFNHPSFENYKSILINNFLI